jgi:tagatose 1,6-diphosphate aldolase
LRPNLTPGKRRGLEKVADARGVIADLAIDQRGAMRVLFGKAMGVAPEAVPDEKLIQYKEAVSRILTARTNAILFDPEYGLRVASIRAKTAGLLLAYEKTGYDKSVKGRLPKLLEH